MVDVVWQRSRVVPPRREERAVFKTAWSGRPSLPFFQDGISEKEQKMDTKSLEDIVAILNQKSEEYDLCGIEFTMEDAEDVAKLMADGKSKEEAIEEVLAEIRNVLEM
jgi:hypothetical protein